MIKSDKVRVGVGLSGGADSAAACLKLLGAGYEALAFTMVVDEAGFATADKARAVAERLHVEHVVVDVRQEFETQILKRFVDEYSRGLTPSPCVVCNRLLKFGVLWDAMAEHGCQKLATGHYAEIREGQDGRKQLWRGEDLHKDQSYFLAQLTQKQLGRILFPLHGSQKEEVQELVKGLGIIPRTEGESQDLCFVPGGDYSAVVLSQRPDLKREGAIVDQRTGCRLGTHQGAFMYTPGQRRGLGLGGGPWFVVRTEPETNVVTVAHAEDIQGGRGLLKGMNWLDGEPEAGVEISLDIQIRHLMKPCRGSIQCLGGGMARIGFAEAAPILPPGQLAVGYEGRRVVCSGWICRNQ